MPKSFSRDFKIQIGTVLIESRSEFIVDGTNLRLTGTRPTLDVKFKIEKSTSGNPNKAEISIANLNPDTRKLVQEIDSTVIVQAGYSENTGEIFRGNLTLSTIEREGTDWITKLIAMDGEVAYRNSRISRSYNPGISVEAVVRDVVQCMGLGDGNIADKLNTLVQRGTIKEYKNGMSVCGRCSNVLKKLSKSFGFNFSIQDNEPQLLSGDRDTTNQVAVVLSTSTGMLGSPQVGENGSIQVRSLLNPLINSGRQIQVKRLIPRSEGDTRLAFDEGFFKAQKLIHTGDTSGREWFTDTEGIRLS